MTGPAAVSPLGDRRCNPWGLRGKLKGVVSQGFHRLDPEAARVRQSQPGPGQRRFQLLCVITVNIPEAPTSEPHSMGNILGSNGDISVWEAALPT